jgi:integrase
MRLGEIVSLRVDQIDLDRRVLRLTQTKNGASRTVPLTRAAAEVLTAARDNPLRPKETDLVAGVNYFFRWRQLFFPVLSLHHWSTIAQSGAKGVRSSVSEIC